MSHPEIMAFAAKFHDVANRIESLQRDLIRCPELQKTVIKLNPVAHLRLVVDGPALADGLKALADQLRFKPGV